MDHFMTGIRNEMAKTTRLLNIQKNKTVELEKTIEEKKREIDEQKNPNKYNTITTPEVSTNNTFKSIMNEKNSFENYEKKKKKMKKVKNFYNIFRKIKLKS